MIESRVCRVGLVAFILLCVLAPMGVLAGNPKVIWPSYHGDMLRRGTAPPVSGQNDIDNPASINLIWTFPRAEANAISEEDQYKLVVDNKQTLFAASGNFDEYWNKDAWAQTGSVNGSTAIIEVPKKVGGIDYYSYWQADAIPQYDKNGNANPHQSLARWRFPTDIPKGLYQIWIWVPIAEENVTPAYNFTKKAVYKVYDDNQAGTSITFDQSNGGTWQLLSIRPFSFKKDTGSFRVELTDVTGDTVDEVAAGNVKVAADAIKFVPTTGMEIYSSPTSAIIDYYWDDGTSPPIYYWSGRAPVVYTGTLEQPLSNVNGAPSTGKVYCINSVTPDNNPWVEKTEEEVKKMAPTDRAEYEVRKGLASQLGKPIWQYPRDFEAMNPAQVAAFVAASDIDSRLRCEGPIEEGVFSSPTLATVAVPKNLAQPTTTVCLVTARDKQFYALDATSPESPVTPRLLFKGPGVTVSEDNADKSWTQAPAVNSSNVTTSLRNDAFGGRFMWTRCASSQTASMTWNFNTVGTGQPNGSGQGWNYAVYVWMPTVRSGDLLRAKDAEYAVTHSGGTTVVHVDQSSSINNPPSPNNDQPSHNNQGRWVKLGSYFNVSSLTLINEIAPPGGSASESDYCVVADAAMIVPDTIGAFGYCTPALNVMRPTGGSNSQGTEQATKAYMSTAVDGRIIGIDILASLKNSKNSALGTVGNNIFNAQMDWVFPKIRTISEITDPHTQADEPSLGSVGASPTYFKSSGTKERLYLPTLNGRVYALDLNANPPTPINVTVNGTKYPYFFDTQKDPVTGLNPGFTSSINIGLTGVDGDSPETLYVGSVSGYFYSFDPDLVVRQRVPATLPNGTTDQPLGAFRYSTPATVKENGLYRVIAPSAANKIYALDATSLLPSTGFTVPDVGDVIQASPTIDTAQHVIYAGDMSGTLHWYSSQTGNSDWTYNDITDPNFDPLNPPNYTGWQCQGALFSSPNLTPFQESGTGSITTSVNATYLYQGCADGRIYAFSDEGGAWGGEWAGGFWPFQTEPGRRSNSIIKRAPNTEIQVDIFTPTFYANSVSSDPEPINKDSELLATQVSGAAWTADWAVSHDMKLPPDHSSWSGLLGRQKDRAIDRYLRDRAREQRDAKDALSNDAIFPTKARRTNKAPIYFEWGDSFNIIVWNLPPIEFLSGGSASSILYKLENTTAGSGGGFSNFSNGNFTSIPGATLKEYTVLNYKDKKSGGGYGALTYSRNSTPVKRCYFTGKIPLDLKRPMSPGTGWRLYIQFRHRRTNDSSEPFVSEDIPIAELKAGSPTMPETVANDFVAQALGVNNPLSIQDDISEATKIYQPDKPSVSTPTGIGWPLSGWQLPADFREYPDRHFNGNAIGSFGTETKMPLIDLQYVNHGSASREAKLMVADASAFGTINKALDKFRIDNGELIWNGGTSAIDRAGSVWLPWEYGSGSVDYPNIYKSRELFRKASDDDLPTDRPTSLPYIKSTFPSGGTVGLYEGSYLQPETVFTSVDVPRFQPANFAPRLSTGAVGSLIADYDNAGYSRLMTAYIDSYPIGGNNQFDLGNPTNSVAQTGQDVFRRFFVGVMVPADPKIEVEEQVVDVGIAPHGLGDSMGDFTAYSLDPLVAQWFKPITIKNAGNVNLWNMRIGRFPGSTSDAGANLYVDQVGCIPPIGGMQITSSLDCPIGSTIMEPFGSLGLGYTLTKARVGDTDPSVMTIPDKRKWDMNYNNVRLASQAIYANYANAAGLTNATLNNPLPVNVSVRVPLAQPVGTYQSFDPYYNVPYVPVFSDRNNNGTVDIASDIMLSDSVAQKSFQMKVSVREAQATGGVTPISLPHIDGAYPQYQFGDATPAAYRDPKDGNVFLVWSNNRNLPTPEPTSPEEYAKAMADAPWFLSYTILGSNPQRTWTPVTYSSGNYWWDTPAQVGAGFAEKCWPADLIGAYKGWTKLPWAADSSFLSVRHSSPVFAPYEIGGNYGAQVAWVGTADVKDSGGTEKVAQEHRIFYMDQKALGSSDTMPFWIEHDPTQVKRYPSMAVDPTNDKVWMLWQGGDEGRWGLYCSTNRLSNIGSPIGINTWTKDMKLLVPDCLTSVSAPNALLRRLWGGDTGLMDVVYSGNTKLGQTSDIMLTRYAPVDETTPALASAMPSNFAQPLPRVFDEKLERDSTYGFYAAQSLAWIRPGKGDKPVDNWIDITEDSKKKIPSYLPYSDLPYIRVVLPIGYPIPGGSATTTQVAISATDGSVWTREKDTDLWALSDPAVSIDQRTADVDSSSGVYIYKYPSGSLANTVLGDVLVDYSAGVVRFTKMLSEIKSGDSFISAGVYADYTPRTWRLTTDKAADSSPRAFIEKTNMYCDRSSPSSSPNPGLGSEWRTSGAPGGRQPVDRMWVFWRKAAAGAQSSTIYYSTYRVGVELSDLFKRSGRVMTPGAKYEITGVKSAIGPWEIDKSGTKVYFTQADERYRSLANCGSSAIYGSMPGAITITYTENGDESSLPARDVFWIPELRGESLLGFSADGNVNEGSIYAFADPFTGTFTPAYSSKIWLFWTSTRGGTSDLFWETLSPDFAAR